NERKSRAPGRHPRETSLRHGAEDVLRHGAFAHRGGIAMKTFRIAVLLASVAALPACQQVPAKPPAVAAEEPAAPAQAPPPPVATAPTPPPPPTGPVSQAAQQQAQKAALAAVGMLEAGHEDEAKAELQRALSLDPNNKLALNLKRQIEADPVT